MKAIDNRQFKFGSYLRIFFSLKSISIIGFFLIVCSFVFVTVQPISKISKTQNQQLEVHSSEIIREVSKTGELLTEELTKTLLRQKAHDVVDKLMLYKSANGGFQFASPGLIAIAVEKIAESGYTAIYDCHNFKTLAHPNRAFVGTDGRLLKDKLSDWFKIWNSNCQASEGSYFWPDKNGVNQKKYMVVTPVNKTGLMVAATMPLEEFHKSAYSLQNASERSLKEFAILLRGLTKNTLETSIAAALAFIFIFLLLNFLCWKMFTRFVNKINLFAEELSRDDYDTKIDLNFRIREFQAIGFNLDRMRNKIINYHNVSVLAASHKAAWEISTQVAHDIRSPLASLQGLMGELTISDPSHRKILKNALNRISDIANGLLNSDDKFLIPSPSLSPTLVSSLIDSIVSEMRLSKKLKANNLHLNLTFDKGAEKQFSKIDVQKLKRSLSNFINNSIDASSPNQTIEVMVSFDDLNQNIIIQISDEGFGFSDEALLNLGKVQFTDKKNGNGIGTLSSCNFINEMGGTVNFSNVQNSGACVVIALPTCLPPSHLQTEISLFSSSKVCIIDDDKSLLGTWANKLKALAIPPTLSNQAITISDSDNFDLFLVDLDLGVKNEDGLDFIKKAGIQNKSILVTSFSEDDDVLVRAKGLGVKVLPKSLIPSLSIEIKESLEKKIILIDDDLLIPDYWGMSARSKGIELIHFKDSKDTLSGIVSLSRDTPIYLDVNLGNESGEDLVPILYDMGFKNITYASGYTNKTFKHMNLVKGVHGKEVPAFL